MIQNYFADLPVNLRGMVSKLWRDYECQCSAFNIDPIEDDRVLAMLAKVWCCSQFVSTWCIRHPDSFQELVLSGDLFSKNVRQYFLVTLKNRIDALESESDVIAELRRLHRLKIFVKAFRNLCRPSWVASRIIRL